MALTALPKPLVPTLSEAFDRSPEGLRPLRASEDDRKCLELEL